VKKGHTGTSLGSVEMSPRRRKSGRRKLKRQEECWAGKSGEVTVSYLPGYGPSSGQFQSGPDESS
jgi:hypothetical protein